MDRATPEVQRASGKMPAAIWISDKTDARPDATALLNLESHVVRVRSARPGTALLPSTECAGGLAEPGKLVKDALVMERWHQGTHLLHQYLPGHWMGIGNKWVITMAH
jgi:hypothetical protein